MLGRISRREPLIFLGDYIDRGPDVAGCVERLLTEQHRSIFLMGNHEEMLLAHFNHRGETMRGSWTAPVNGGLETLRSYGIGPEAGFNALPKSHRDFFSGLRRSYESEKFIAVHAGVDPLKNDMASQDAEDFLWIRNRWIAHEARWQGKKVYFGHTPSRTILGADREHEPIRGKKSLGIDTGCVYGGSLTAVNSETGTLIQVPAKKVYW